MDSAGAGNVNPLARLVVAVLLPSLAVLLGLQRSVGTELAPQPAAPPVEPQQHEHAPPPGYCRARFLSPFLHLTGGHVAQEYDEKVDGDEQQTAHTSTVTGAGQTGQASDWPRELARAVRSNLERLDPQVDIDVMIATLPDPIDSGLGYQFDAQLGALVLGMEASAPSPLWSTPTLSYNRDRDWMPWNDRTVDEAQRARSQSCRHELPGVVLFRGSGVAPRVMVLLLVGESPITGVHMGATRAAVRLAAALMARPEALRQSQSERELKVLGPTFSGSASSLQRALSDWPERSQYGLNIISGTASGPDVPRILLQGRARARTSYAATTIPEGDLLCAFLYMARRAGARTGVGAPPSAVDGVAILRESGTEFGATSARGGGAGSSDVCPLKAEIQLSFPFHISAIREAYEELDRSLSRQREDATIERHTALDISLSGAKRIDVASPSSGVTKFAQDLALSNVLGEISREGVRWLGIQATDVADAIFLARKIRDVAPDVRLAFFTADALLLHPSFRTDLLGSLVISPYPFLGSNDFWPRKRLMDHTNGGIVSHAHASFPNAEAEGTFNAALALRGVAASELSEYAFIKPDGASEAAVFQPLPVWISTVARSGIVPLRVSPVLDCNRTIYGRGKEPPRELCAAPRVSNAATARAWEEFNSLRELELHVDPDVTPPRLWNFVFGLLALACFLHWRFERQVEGELLPSEPFPPAIVLGPGGLAPATADARLDRCIVRAKWRLYGFFAQLTLLIAATYFFAVYAIAVATYARHDSAHRLTGILLLSVALLAFTSWRAAAVLHRTWRDMRSFARCLSVEPGPPLRANGMPSKLLVGRTRATDEGGPPAASPILLWLGFADARPPGWSVYVSYAQLRGVFWIGTTLAGCFTVGIATSLWSVTDAGRSWGDAVPALTLFALRSLPMTNGVSPAVPLLVALICTYCWSLGRMARLRVLHGLARMSPDDGVMDCVSTPIRAILFPSHSESSPADHGFTACERRLINTVLRPNGHSYLFATSLVSFLPVILFLLKRPTTLEPERDTYLLFAALGLCALLVSATLIQMFQYWRALRAVLRRLMVHPVGAAFQRVSAPIRADIDRQVSRSGDDLQELAACADVYERLLADPSGPRLLREALSCADLEEHGASPSRLGMSQLRRRALGERLPGEPSNHQSSIPPRAVASPRRDALGKAVLKSAALVVQKALLRQWYPLQAHALRDDGAGGAGATIPPPSLPPPGPPPTQSSPPDAAAQSWRQRAETYVAMVVAVLVLRHVRQFKYFLYTATICALLLLLAVSSYPFEPHRALLLCMWLLISAVVGLSLWLFMQLDRDPLLSSLSGHLESAGKVSLNSALLQRVLIWFLTPMLGLLAAQYPAVARALGLVFEPFMRVLQ